MDDDVENLQQGYESRHVVSTIWINSILGLIDAEDNCAKAAVHATLSCSFNALAVTEVCFDVLITFSHAFNRVCVCGAGRPRAAQRAHSGDPQRAAIYMRLPDPGAARPHHPRGRAV